MLEIVQLLCQNQFHWFSIVLLQLFLVQYFLIALAIHLKLLVVHFLELHKLVNEVEKTNFCLCLTSNGYHKTRLTDIRKTKLFLLPFLYLVFGFHNIQEGNLNQHFSLFDRHNTVRYHSTFDTSLPLFGCGWLHFFAKKQTKSLEELLRRLKYVFSFSLSFVQIA